VVWNFFSYSVDIDNLAEHTLHGRYLHFLINFPLLFGPIGILTYYWMMKNFSFDNIYLWTIVSGLGFYSIIPHQEPRFILPLACPIILYLVQVKTGNFKLLFIISVLFSSVFSTFYGVIHQGGVLNVLVNHEDPHSSVIFYHTYMPPDYLTAMKYRVVDLPSCIRQEYLMEVIHTLRRETNSSIYLVFPNTLELSEELKIEKKELFCPHFSGEDPPPLMNLLEKSCLVKLKIE
jgi:hypothetical protein